MSKFERYALVVMSIVLLVVAASNAFVNYVQNDRLTRLKNTVEIIYAELDKTEDESVNRDNQLLEIIKKMSEGQL